MLPSGLRGPAAFTGPDQTARRLFDAQQASARHQATQARQVRFAQLSTACNGSPAFNLGNGASCAPASGTLVAARVELGAVSLLSVALPRSLQSTTSFVVVAPVSFAAPVPAPARPTAITDPATSVT